MAGGYFKKKCCRKSSSSSSGSDSSSSSSGGTDICPGCADIVPAAYLVKISGIINVGCANCNNLNNDYVCDIYLRPGAFGDCEWRYIFPSTICTIGRTVTSIGRNSVTLKRYVVVVLEQPGGGNFLSFRKEFTTEQIHCEKFDNEIIPFNTDNLFLQCDRTNAVCLLTSL